MPFRSTKTYGHEIGLSCCFRQWRAHSHCHILHGYALAVRLEFEAEELDRLNWVVDFGSLKGFKGWLEDTFDHALLVAKDDPQRERLLALGEGDIDAQPLARIVEVEACGCEAFAKLIYESAAVWLQDNGYAPRVRIARVEVSEHGANSAIYYGA